MKKKFKFQIKNGYIGEGSFGAEIRNYIAEIDEADLTIPIKHMIEARGGQEIAERPVPKIVTLGKNKKNKRGDL